MITTDDIYKTRTALTAKKCHPSKIKYKMKGDGSSLKAQREAFSRWRGSDYELAAMINMACVTRGRIAFNYFELALRNGVSIEAIEYTLKRIGRKIIFDYIGSKLFTDARRKIHIARINTIIANLKIAIQNKKIAHTSRKIFIGTSPFDGRYIESRISGYKLATLECILQYIDRTDSS